MVFLTVEGPPVTMIDVVRYTVSNVVEVLSPTVALELFERAILEVENTAVGATAVTRACFSLGIAETVEDETCVHVDVDDPVGTATVVLVSTTLVIVTSAIAV